MRTSSSLGNFIRTARAKHGLSIRALAELSGVGHATISRFESERHGIPKPEVLQALAKHLDLDLYELQRLAGYAKLRPKDIAYLKRRPLAIEMLWRMADADTKEPRIERMMKLAKE